jgi:hypothetical protein
LRPLNARIAAQLSQRLEIAFRRKQLPDRSGDGRLVGFIGENVDHTVQQADEILDLITLFALNGVQFALTLVDRAHAPDEHVGEIVAGAHAHAVEQRDDQRVAFLGRSVVPERRRRAPSPDWRASATLREPGDGQ